MPPSSRNPGGDGVAALVPSASDLVVELGCATRLVAVSHECDHPDVASLPVVTRPNVPAAGEGGATSAAVDAAVSAAARRGDALYAVDGDRLAALAPAVVVVQDVCSVCAVDHATARAALPAGGELVVLSAATLDGLAADVRRLGAALGVSERAEEVVADVAAAVAAARASAPRAPRRPRVAVIEWGDPPFVAGHWAPELVDAVGGEAVLSAPGQPSRRVSWADLHHARPDLVVYAPCGYDEAAAVEEVNGLLLGPLGRLVDDADLGLVVIDAARWLSRCTPASVTGALGILAQAVVRPRRGVSSRAGT